MKSNINLTGSQNRAQVRNLAETTSYIFADWTADSRSTWHSFLDFDSFGATRSSSSLFSATGLVQIKTLSSYHLAFQAIIVSIALWVALQRRVDSCPKEEPPFELPAGSRPESLPTPAEARENSAYQLRQNDTTAQYNHCKQLHRIHWKQGS